MCRLSDIVHQTQIGVHIVALGGYLGSEDRESQKETKNHIDQRSHTELQQIETHKQLKSYKQKNLKTK